MRLHLAYVTADKEMLTGATCFTAATAPHHARAVRPVGLTAKIEELRAGL